jgi:hypothetical protein
MCQVVRPGHIGVTSRRRWRLMVNCLETAKSKVLSRIEPNRLIDLVVECVRSVVDYAKTISDQFYSHQPMGLVPFLIAGKTIFPTRWPVNVGNWPTRKRGRFLSMDGICTFGQLWGVKSACYLLRDRECVSFPKDAASNPDSKKGAAPEGSKSKN